MNLHQLVIDAAARHPDRLAVAGPAGSLRYRDLDARANEMAWTLRRAGVGRGDRVVIWAEKSAAVLVAMQATLRLGAAYVLADETIPIMRLLAMVTGCAARAVCATAEQAAALRDELDAAVACLDLAPAAAALPAAALPAAALPVNEPVAAGDLAYIIYTSGSTGTPKGVCVSHGNARAFVDWAVATLGARPADRFSSHAPLTFDLSVLDLYAAFSVAASVHLVPPQLAYAPAQLVDFLYREEISVWYSVPSALTLMLGPGGLTRRAAPPALRAILFAGEPFPIAGVRALAAWTGARLLNLYGPTETNVCTFHEVSPADLERDRPVPIGTGASGDAVWAERDDGTLAWPGEEGELVAAGPTVMLGYWGQAAQRLPYRTGDIVRVQADWSLDYVSRRDHLVKVRGHRVELAEIELALMAHPDVEQAVALAEGDGMNTRLVALVVPRAGCEPGVLALKRHLAQRLPRYMIADRVDLVPDLPRTGNGKVDRAAIGQRQPGAADLLDAS